jgi:hypothetical protein
MIYVHSYVDGSVISSFVNNPVTAIEDWQAATPFGEFRGLAFGNNVFVGVSLSFSYSYDGINWTFGYFIGGQHVTFGNGQFVSVGSALSGGVTLISYIYTSTDGINWTSRTASEGMRFRDISFGNGLYVAVASEGTNRIMTSPNGITWTSRTTSINPEFSGVAYGNGIWVAVTTSSSGGKTFTSYDGITWTERATTFYANSIFFTDGLFVTGGEWSTDGLNWTAATNPFNPNAITYGNGYFVGVTSLGTNRFFYSTTGKSWTSTLAASVAGFQSVTFGNNTFVAGAISGTEKINYNYFEDFESEIIGDQDTAKTTWIPVGGDQLLQYQRPIKKLTVKQGGLGQSIITNGESFNESSWFLEGPYKPFDWTITPDPDSTVIQIFPNNIPAQSGFDDEQGVSWDIRFMANGEETDEPITSKPIFLDFAGLSLDLEVDINYSTLESGLAIALKHVDSSGTTRYLGTSIVGALNLLAWDEAYNTFVFYSTKDDDTRKFKLSSFVLPTAGFLSIELKFFGETGSAVVTAAKIIPTFEGKRNPSEVTKIYETARDYTSLRADTLRFSDLAITASKNWLKVGDLPAIVFVEKSLASTPGIIQVPSGAVTQVNRLTDTLGSNTLDFTGGVVNGQYQRQYVAASGFTISSTFVLVNSLSGIIPTGSAVLPIVTTISSQQRNLTVTFDDYDYTGEANIQIQVFLKDSNSNDYQVSTFLLQVNSNGSITYSQTDISFENQALLGGYSPRLRDCYARNVLTIYNALSYRLEGSFRRKGDTFGNGYIGTQLVYTGFSTVRLQVIGWEYDLASRVARITFGQVPTAYVYPIN